MAKKKLPASAPVYCLDSFTTKAKENLFYIERLTTHLQEHPFISKPHRHDFYLILYITQGGGTHTIDFVSYKIKPQSFFVMTPGQVHSWSLDVNTDGYILFFIPEFYRMGLADYTTFEFPFFHALNPDPFITLPRGNEQLVNTFVTEMFNEYTQSIRIDLRILRSYLDLLLLILAKRYRTEDNKPTQGPTFKIRKLEELIDRHFKTMKLPHEYAEKMNMSASYLNTLCKQMLGKTLSTLIHERVILEAKRLFAYSDFTVSQIADELNFSEASYFARFFRKETGLTPEQFRTSINRAG